MTGAAETPAESPLVLAQATTAPQTPAAPQAPSAPEAAAPEAPVAPEAAPPASPDAPSAAGAPAADVPPAADAPAAAEVPAADAPPAAEAPAGDPGVPGAEAPVAADAGPGTGPGAVDAPGAPTGGEAIAPDGMAEAAAGPFGGAFDSAFQMLHDGGPAVWAIAALSVVTVALILWKTWTLMRLGAWSRARSERAMAAYMAGGPEAGLAALRRRPGLRGRMLRTGFTAVATLPPEAAREETARVAKRELADARTGLRALELIATAAPLLGLLGTVLGMIAAFRTLQEAGGRADPAMLAGGIWEALLTTAAGMAVAIPASAALTWFESVADRARQDMEDLGARLFLAPAVARDPATGLSPEGYESRADAA